MSRRLTLWIRRKRVASWRRRARRERARLNSSPIYADYCDAQADSLESTGRLYFENVVS